jgi:hypothetical protein
MLHPQPASLPRPAMETLRDPAIQIHRRADRRIALHRLCTATAEAQAEDADVWAVRREKCIRRSLATSAQLARYVRQPFDLLSESVLQQKIGNAIETGRVVINRNRTRFWGGKSAKMHRHHSKSK